MQTQQQLNYERIASAIRFIKENRREQPKLEEVSSRKTGGSNRNWKKWRNTYT